MFITANWKIDDKVQSISQLQPGRLFVFNEPSRRDGVYIKLTAARYQDISDSNIRLNVKPADQVKEVSCYLEVTRDKAEA